MSDNQQKKHRKPKRGRPCKHGGYSLLTRGLEAIPQKRKRVSRYLTSLRESLIRDLGPMEEDLTAAQLVLIDRIITFLGVIRLIEEHAAENGVLDSKGQPSQGLTGHYLTFNRQVKEMLSLLGIKERAGENVLDLHSYINAKYGADKSSDQGEIGDPGASQAPVRGKGE